MRPRLPRISTLLCLCAGCFGDPPAQDTESTTAPTTEGGTSETASTGPSGATSTPQATADETRGVDVDADADADADATGETTVSNTGPGETCGDGIFELGEICLPDEPSWVRTFDGTIADIALASIGGDSGSGGVLLFEPPESSVFYWWAWDGASQAGPMVSVPHELVGVPRLVKAGDFEASGSDGFIVASDNQTMHWYWDGSALLFDGPCPSEGGLLAVGNLDEDAPLEIAWVPDDGGNGLSIWLDITATDWCEGVAASLGGKGKPNALAVGPFVGDDPDDIAQVLGPSVYIGEVVVPFGIGESASFDYDEAPVAFEAADLDGDGAAGELVIAGAAGVAMISTGPLDIGPPTPAGTVADLAVADLDGDGDDDVIVVDVTAPSPLLLINTGARSFTVALGPATPVPSSAVAAKDINDDGAVDLVFGGVDGSVRAYLAEP